MSSHSIFNTRAVLPIWHCDDSSGWKNCHNREPGTKVEKDEKSSPDDVQKFNVFRSKLSLLTLNVWFGRFKFDDRTRQQIALFQELNPDVICLQEVTEEFIQELIAHKWIKENYFCLKGLNQSFYGLFILSRIQPVESSLVVLPSTMDRCLQLCIFQINNQPFAVGNVHLESLDSRELRSDQLQISHDILDDYPNKVLVGDFNFDSTKNWSSADQRPLEQNGLDKMYADYCDVWSSLHPDEPGLTFDTERNAMMKVHREEKMRYDRIMFSSHLPKSTTSSTSSSASASSSSSINNEQETSPSSSSSLPSSSAPSLSGGVWVPSKIELVGQESFAEAMPGEIGPNGRMLLGKLPVCISDHFGLYAEFEWQEREY